MTLSGLRLIYVNGGQWWEWWDHSPLRGSVGLNMSNYFVKIFIDTDVQYKFLKQLISGIIKVSSDALNSSLIKNEANDKATIVH